MWITDLYTEKAVERIQNHNSSVPLFLYLAFQAPHSPIPRPPDKYMSQYKGLRTVYQAGLPNGSQAIHRAAAVTAMDVGVGKVVEIIEMLTMLTILTITRWWTPSKPPASTRTL